MKCDSTKSFTVLDRFYFTLLSFFRQEDIVNSLISPLNMKEARSFCQTPRNSFQLELLKRGPRKDNSFKRTLECKDDYTFGKVRKISESLITDYCDSIKHPSSSPVSSQDLTSQFSPPVSADSSHNRIHQVSGTITNSGTPLLTSAVVLKGEGTVRHPKISGMDFAIPIENLLTPRQKDNPNEPLSISGTDANEIQDIFHRPSKSRPYKIVKKKNLLKKTGYVCHLSLIKLLLFAFTYVLLWHYIVLI